MEKIEYVTADGHIVSVEVGEDFAKTFRELEHRENLVNRKETRRHQSLKKSLDNGFDISDPQINIELEIEHNEEKIKLHKALQKLTKRQRTVFLLYVLEKQSFREIGETLGLNKDTVREHYISAIKKLKNILS